MSRDLPRGVTRYLDGQRSAGECRDLADRLKHLDGLPLDDRVRREQRWTAQRFLRHLSVVEQAAATGDLVSGAADRFAGMADYARGLLDHAAPIERPDDDDWETWAATPALGAHNARKKLRSIAGKALFDGLTIGLVRRLAQLENTATCEPPLTRAAVDELVDSVLIAEASR